MSGSYSEAIDNCLKDFGIEATLNLVFDRWEAKLREDGRAFSLYMRDHAESIRKEVIKEIHIAEKDSSQLAMRGKYDKRELNR